MVLSSLPGLSHGLSMTPGRLRVDKLQPCLGRLLESSGLFGLLAPSGLSKWSINGSWLSPG